MRPPQTYSMKTKYSMQISCALLALTLSLTAGCAPKEEKKPDQSTPPAASSSQTAKPENQAPENEEFSTEGLTPVYAKQLKDGTYDITVDSSSSMFNVESCQLTVADGKMTAVMTMGGTGYLKVFMGTSDGAASADESAFIPFEETADGKHIFTVPVEALDSGVDCAAFSKKKEKWYDRTLIFRADSLPMEAWIEPPFTSVDSLNLADGDYEVAVALVGGSGKAGVASPARVSIQDGKATATIVWSSSNYDYMIVDGVTYEPIALEGGSTFQIPVAGFDWNMPVVADTVAMGTPHEISYTLNFDSATMKAVK